MNAILIKIVEQLNYAAQDAQEHLSSVLLPFTYMTDGVEDYVYFFNHPVWSTIDGTPESDEELRSEIMEELSHLFASLGAISTQSMGAILTPPQPIQPEGPSSDTPVTKEEQP